MEELREITKAYLEVATTEINTAARNFFEEMDENGDGKVSLPEFLAFMRQEGYRQLRSSDLFNQLCSNDSKHLEFNDVMTLYYIIRSGRPFCDGCNQFIEGFYFCCIHCFKESETNYCLCTQCLKAEKSTNCRGNKRHQFLDNFTLLEQKKREALKNAPTSSQVSAATARSTSRTLVPAATVGSTSLALVPAATVGSTSLALAQLMQEKYRKRRAALRALERVMMFGGSVAQIIACNIQ